MGFCAPHSSQGNVQPINKMFLSHQVPGSSVSELPLKSEGANNVGPTGIRLLPLPQSSPLIGERGLSSISTLCTQASLILRQLRVVKKTYPILLQGFPHPRSVFFTNLSISAFSSSVDTVVQQHTVLKLLTVCCDLDWSVWLQGLHFLPIRCDV